MVMAPNWWVVVTAGTVREYSGSGGANSASTIYDDASTAARGKL